MPEKPLDLNQEMLELMRAREKRESEQYLEQKKEADRLAATRAEKSRRIEEQFAQEARMKARRWAACDHLRGKIGTGFRAPLIKTSFLGLHIFPDNTVRVKCEKCGMKWYKTDTREHIIRDGQKLSNPTGMSFIDALQKYQEGDPDKVHTSSALRFGQVVDAAQEQLKR